MLGAEGSGLVGELRLAPLGSTARDIHLVGVVMPLHIHLLRWLCRLAFGLGDPTQEATPGEEQHKRASANHATATHGQLSDWIEENVTLALRAAAGNCIEELGTGG
jgi:hypothetical protein